MLIPGRRTIAVRRWWVILLCLGLIGGVSCARVSQSREVGLRIDLVGPLFPPPVGPGRLAVRLSDASGKPVAEAVVAVRGDMTHAGMTPVLAEAEFVGDGIYQAEMDWTMAGDWVMTVDATLPDGRASSRQFELAVTNEEPECNETE